MKTILICWLVSCSIVLLAQGLEIKVTNTAPFDRPIETIEIPWNDLEVAFDLSGRASLGVFEKEQQLVSQTIDLDGNGVPELFLFQSQFNKGEEKIFTLKKMETTPNQKPVAVAQFMIPREDVAWENDKIAYRIYGSPRAGDVRSGLDVLVKRVPYHVLDKWYHADSLKGSSRISYHVDHGEGADFFTVGKSLGGGGCCLWVNDSMIISGLFTSHSIIASGPIRAMFKVAYERDTVNGKPFVEEKTYTLDAGDYLNKIEVSYSGLTDTGAVSVALGLVKRKNVTFSSDEKEGWFSLWGLATDDSTDEFLSTGVVIPGTSYRETKDTESHYLMIGKTSPDKRLTYYGGGGWSKSGDFPTEEHWRTYLSKYSQRLHYPLNISYTLKGH